MAPGWVQILAYISLGLAILCSLIITIDILAGRRQHMPVMNLVWIVSAWYFGPVALWFYWKRGRRMSKPMIMGMMSQGGKQQDSGDMHRRMMGMMRQMAETQPFWFTTAKGTTHCGTGCMLGDLIGEWIVFGTGFVLAGSEFNARLVLVFILAYLLGIVIQYKTIAPLRGESFWPGLRSAVKADTLSLVAFEIGMFAWMALSYYALFTPPLRADDPVFWFMMQIAMIVGFGFSYPMNWFLLRQGIKEKM